MKKTSVCFVLAALLVTGGAVGETIDAIPITAQALFLEYQANEVAADRKFQGRYLAVTGRIAEISKDFMGGVFLALRTSNQFQSVHANLADSEHDRAAQLKRGQGIMVLCKGGGMTIGSPVLQECRIMDPDQPKPAVTKESAEPLLPFFPAPARR